MRVGVLVDDLFFLAKILETAKATGVEVIRADTSRGPAGVIQQNPRAVIVDLNCRSTSAVGFVQTLKSDPATATIRIIGFVSHVQEAVIAAAKAAGCDAVMARSAFSKQLPDILRGLTTETAN